MRELVWRKDGGGAGMRGILLLKIWIVPERNIRRFKTVLFHGGIFYHLRIKNRNMDKLEGLEGGLKRLEELN